MRDDTESQAEEVKDRDRKDEEEEAKSGYKRGGRREGEGSRWTVNGCVSVSVLISSSGRR